MASVNFNPPTLGQITDDPRYNERNGLAAAAPISATLWFSNVAPPAVGVGGNGDFALVPSGTAAGHTLLYHKEGGAWVATAA